MKRSFLFSFLILLFSFVVCNAQTSSFDKTDRKINTLQMKQEYIKADIYESNSRFPLKVTMVGHGSVMLECMGGTIIHVDPYSKIADYTRLPKADIILLTHEHSDHLDTTAINAIRKADTRFIVSKTCAQIIGYGYVLNNGDSCVLKNIDFRAVPAYNIVHKRDDGQAYHPKGIGNGYVLTFDNLMVYIAGDTENIPEMDALKGRVDIAFLPKNLPYTMTDDMFVDAAKRIAPKYLYPYHFSEFDRDKLSKQLEGTGIELRVRAMSNK